MHVHNTGKQIWDVELSIKNASTGKSMCPKTLKTNCCCCCFNICFQSLCFMCIFALNTMKIIFMLLRFVTYGFHIAYKSVFFTVLQKNQLRE